MGRRKPELASNAVQQQQNNEQLTLIGFQCFNCSCEVTAARHVGFFKLSERVISVLEGLKIVFDSKADKMRDCDKADFKFCCNCGEIFGHIVRLMLKFLDKTTSESLMSNMINKKIETQDKATLTAQAISSPYLENISCEKLGTRDKATLTTQVLPNLNQKHSYTPSSAVSPFIRPNTSTIKLDATSSTSLRKHFDSKPEIIEVELNDIVPKNLPEVSAMSKNFPQSDNTGGIHNVFVCEVCNNYSHRDKRMYVCHMRRFHPDEADIKFPKLAVRPITREEEKWIKLTEYKCGDFPCRNVSFPGYMDWLIHHRDSHNLSSNYWKETVRKIKTQPDSFKPDVQPCPRCWKRVCGRRKMVDHIRIAHMGQKLFQCVICGKSTSTKSNLQQHMQVKHPNESEITTVREKALCAQCGTEFKSEGSLRCHEKLHHSTKPHKVFECPECDKHFLTKPRLKDHMDIIHSKTDDFAFSCEFCGKGFKARTLYRTHRDRHIKRASKNEICEFCGKAYGFKVILKEHLIATHKLSLEDARKSAKMKPPPKAVTRVLSTGEVIGPRVLKPKNVCIDCGRHFARRDNLYVHLMSAHGVDEETAKRLTQFETRRKLSSRSGGAPVLLKLTDDAKTD